MFRKNWYLLLVLIMVVFFFHFCNILQLSQNRQLPFIPFSLSQILIYWFFYLSQLQAILQLEIQFINNTMNQQQSESSILQIQNTSEQCHDTFSMLLMQALSPNYPNRKKSYHTRIKSLLIAPHLQPVTNNLKQQLETFKITDRLEELIRILIEHLKQLILTPSSAKQIGGKLEIYIQRIKLSYVEQKNINIKSILQQFFHEYSQTLSMAISKITKYHCDKKLRYLIETVCKQIFIQILRFAYQIKLQNGYFGAQSEKKSIIMINKLTQLIFHKNGNVLSCFRRIKNIYKSQLVSDQIFVQKLENKLTKLQRLLIKNKKQTISTYLYKWRVGSRKTVQKQQCDVLQFARDLLYSFCNCFSGSNTNNIWKSAINSSLNNLFINLKEKNNSQTSIRFFPHEHLREVSTDHLQRIQTHRKYTFDYESITNRLQYQTLSSTIEKALQTGQIQYRKTDNKEGSMVIPILQIGVIQLLWKDTLDMNMFRAVLKIVQQCSQIIQKGYQLGRKLQNSEQKYKENYWERLMFKEFLQLQSHQQQRNYLANYQENINRLSNQNQHKQAILEMYSISERMDQGNEQAKQYQKIQEWLAAFQIQSISIYHLKKQNAKVLITPCYQLNDNLPFSQQLIHTILQKLKISLVLTPIQNVQEDYIIQDQNYVTLYKNNKTIHIVKLIGGFCKYIFKEQSKTIGWQNIRQSLIPLIIREYQGLQDATKSCLYCFKKQPQHYVQNPLAIEVKRSSQTLQIEEISKILNSQSLLNLQTSTGEIIKNKINKKIFCKILYHLDKECYWTINKNTRNKSKSNSYQIMQVAGIFFNNSQNHILISNPYYQYISALLKNSPMFDYSALQIYQNQHRSSMHILYASSKKAIIILGYYGQEDSIESYIKILKTISSCIDANQQAIKEEDALEWVNQQKIKQYNKQEINTIFQQIRKYQLNKSIQNNDPWYNIIQRYIKTVLTPQAQQIKIYKLNKKSNQFIELLTRKNYPSEQDLSFIYKEYIVSHSNIVSKNYKYLTKSNSLKNQMKQILLPIPKFQISDSDLQNNFIGFLQRKFQLDGTLIHQDYHKLSQIFNLNQTVNLQDPLGHFCIPFIKHNVFIIITLKVSNLFHLTQKIQKIIVSQSNLILDEVFTKIQKDKQLKALPLLKMTLLPSLNLYQKYKIKECINKFYRKMIRKNKGCKEIVQKINKILQIKDLCGLRQGIYHLRLKSIEIENQNRILIQNFNQVLNRIFFRRFVDNLIKCQKLNKGVQHICHILYKKQKRIIAGSFNFIKINFQIKKAKLIHQKYQSCSILLKLIKNLKKKKMRLFWESYQRRQESIKKLMNLLAQEYELTVFTTLNSFLQFVQDRVICGIKQVSDNRCELSMGIIQNSTLYLKSSSIVLNQGVIPQEYNLMQIQNEPGHFLVYKFDNLTQTDFKQERQLVVQLMINGIIPSYKTYLQLCKSKVKCLINSISNLTRSSFMLIKQQLQRSCIKNRQNTKKDYQECEKIYQCVRIQYEQIGSEALGVEQKQKLKRIKQQAHVLQQNQNKNVINFHIKRKTNSSYRMVNYLDNRQLAKIVQSDPLPVQHYLQHCQKVAILQQNYRQKVGHQFQKKVSAFLNQKIKRQAKETFFSIWKASRQFGSHNNKYANIIR